MLISAPAELGGWSLAVLVAAALLLDRLIGDPPWLYRLLPHPVAAIGQFIDFLDQRLNRATDPPARRRHAGVATTVLVVAMAGAAGIFLHGLISLLPGPWAMAIEALLASTLIAHRGLRDHVRAVGRALGQNLGEARIAVARIVGRDPASLDRAGIARAAIESLAENFSDGVVAPVFWYVLLGLPGLCAYKAINTLDSMIGHRNRRHQDFGRAAARLDDLINWLPARLSGLIFVVATALTDRQAAARAWYVMRRDAPKHRSPNAGWQEAAVAGALGLALAGPRRYADRTIQDHWMGDGRRDANADDIAAALALLDRGWWLLFGTVVLIAVILRASL